MSDADHIEVLRSCLMRLDGESRRQGLNALAALSARASAGEGGSVVGEDAVRLCHCCGETFDRCRETYRGDSAHAVFYDIPGSGGTMHFQGDKPAQVGAGGGGVCDCIASRCLHEKTCASLTAPASPATEDGPDSFDCPHAHAARVCGCGFCRALNSDRYAFGAPQPAAPRPQGAPDV